MEQKQTFTEDEHQASMDRAWDEIIASQNIWNKEVDRTNKRLLKVLERMHGKAFVKNLNQLLQDCEVSSNMGYQAKYEISRTKGSSYCDERYGTKIKGYWVDQWAVGMEGDSWSGHIYVQLKPGRYLKAEFHM